MDDRFPHLRDNEFPHFATADPYKGNPTFDYSRYDYPLKLKLCRVPWDCSYAHVVGWSSEAERDAYFEGLSGQVIELDSGTVHIDYRSLRVEVPEDTAKLFNYVWIDAPRITPDLPVRHEGVGGVRKVGAFIMDTHYHAVSTTELVLAVDVWTTYLPNKRIRSMMLERGHAPMYALSADDYLADPIGTCSNLLTPDVDFGGYDMVKSGEFVPLYTSSPLIIVASSIPYAELDSIPRASSASSTPASFYDIDARNGHQVGVSGYAWESGKDYAGMNAPATALRTISNNATQWLYAISTAEQLDEIASTLPVFIKSASAAYLIPSDLVTLGTAHAIGQAIAREVSISSDMSTLKNFDIEKSAFGYPAKYADIAKLYTMPYAHIELSDDMGQSVEIAVEETPGSVNVAQQLSGLFPALSWDVLATNVASVAGSARYTWRSLTGSESRTLPNARIAETLMSYGIATFALQLESAIESALGAYNDAQAQRLNAISSYQSTMRTANTGRENTNASEDTSVANTSRTNQTNVANTQRSGSNSTANTNLANNLRTGISGAQISNANAISGLTQQRTFDDGNADGEYSDAATDAQAKSEAVAGLMNAVGNFATGNYLGSVTGGVTSMVSITTSQALAGLSWDFTSIKVAISQSYTQDVTDENNTLNATTTTLQNSNATATNANNVATNNANASASSSTSNTNASASSATSKSNATYSRGTTEENAKQSLETSRQAYLSRIAGGSIEAPARYGSEGGNAIPDALKRKGVHMRVMTQSKAAISRAGDTFIRYGYRLDGLWDVNGNMTFEGERFAYWQSSDVMIDSMGLPCDVERKTRDILSAGVTVWSDPDDVEVIS